MSIEPLSETKAAWYCGRLWTKGMMVLQVRFTHNTYHEACAWFNHYISVSGLVFDKSELILEDLP